MSLLTRFSFYGKLPWFGDFIARDIDFVQQQRIDRWISSAFFKMQAANPDWLEGYLKAPVWNFTLPAGVWLDVPVMGTIMPSVDRVGRYFPFVYIAGIDNCANISQYYEQFYRLANILPELLERELELDEINPFVGNRLQHAVADNFIDNFSTMVVSSVHQQIGLGRSYWWRADASTSFEGDDAQQPTEDLFSCLFNNIYNNSTPGAAVKLLL